MTKRYYYDDRLAAAWMQERHGMMFVDEDGDDIDATSHMLTTPQRPDFYAYIHPGSLHLLKVEEGDLVDDDFEPYIVESDEDHIGMAIIASRDGIPFHWPKVEEAT